MATCKLCGSDCSPWVLEISAGICEKCDIAEFGSSTISHKLSQRYSDAYTGAHALVVVGKTIKGVGVALAVIIVIGGCAMGSKGGREMDGIVVGISFALAFLVGIPTYILGILIAAQSQTQLATLDTAVNSSRHLTDDDVGKILFKRFSL